MSATPWVKWYPADFLNGIADLSPHEIALYTVILCRIYDEDRAIPHDIKKLARRCNMRLPQCERALSALVGDGKLMTDGAFIDNERAIMERERRQKTSAKQSQNATSTKHEGAENANENNNRVKPNAQKNEDDFAPRSQKPEKEVNAKSVYKENAPSAVDLTIPISLDRTEIGEAVRLWNNTAERLGLAQMQKLTASRRAKLTARLQDSGGIDGWAAALEKLAGIPGLIGGGGGGWKADFDFLVAESKFTKLMEGSYDGWTGDISGKSDGFVAVAEGLA